MTFSQFESLISEDCCSGSGYCGSSSSNGDNDEDDEYFDGRDKGPQNHPLYEALSSSAQSDAGGSVAIKGIQMDGYQNANFLAVPSQGMKFVIGVKTTSNFLNNEEYAVKISIRIKGEKGNKMKLWLPVSNNNPSSNSFCNITDWDFNTISNTQDKDVTIPCIIKFSDNQAMSSLSSNTHYSMKAKVMKRKNANNNVAGNGWGKWNEVNFFYLPIQIKSTTCTWMDSCGCEEYMCEDESS